MATITIYQSKSYIGKDNKCPLYIRFYLQKEKIVVPCNMSIKVENFDESTGRIRKCEKGYQDKNLIIDNIKSRINDIMVRYRLRNKPITKESFFKAYNRPDDYDTFYSYFKAYSRKHTREIELSTYLTHKNVISKLERYAPNLYFDDITEVFIKEYKMYLRKKLKNSESTINKNLAVIKKYVRAALKDGYMESDPFSEIKIRRNIKGKFCFLTEDEIKKMIELYSQHILPDGEQSSLEFFLFLCFSSLHISDGKAIHIEQFGEKNFRYFRIKNRNSKPEELIVPISMPLRHLLKNIVGLRAKGKVFEHPLPDQKINFYLKRIAGRLGIGKKLSCIAGRHTFATQYLKETKDVVTLKAILGHSDLRETLIYAHVLEESKQEGIKAFDKYII